jgi:hypothetical protein
VNRTRGLSRLAAAGIVGSLLIMIVVSVAGRSTTVPPMPRATGPLPLEIWAKLPDIVVAFGTWAAVILGAGGVVAGLVAVARGARYPAWLLIGGGMVAVAIFTVLPPAGSTDAVSYAAYGRMAVIGHNPYTTNAVQLERLGDPVGYVAAHLPYWHYRSSLYGPLATAEQWAAARLGGTSVTLIVFWLKLWNAIVFAGIAFGLDWVVRSDPARRARAHLLWTANPLVLWALIAGGHLDVLAAGFGFLGVMMLRTRPGDGRVALPVALGAGLLVGISADIMLDYLIFAPALAWALRKQLGALAAATAGVLITLVPPSLWVGQVYFRGFGSRDGYVGADNFYQLFSPNFKHVLPPTMTALVDLAFVALALLLLWRLPEGPPGMPAVRPALALSLAWLFIWYYTLPWYDTMAIGLLAVYPASRLDWAAIGQFAAATFANMPGLVYSLRPHWVSYIAQLNDFRIMPLLLLTALVALVWMAVSGRWRAPEQPSALSTASAKLRAAAQERLIGWALPARARAAAVIGPPERQAAHPEPEPSDPEREAEKEARGAV